MKPAVVLAAVALGLALGGVASSEASAPSPIVFAADRAPTVTGEIWRLDPNGHRVDLSRSPYQDLFPAVSSDGKRVAFVSERGGAYRLYEVGIDGRGLVRVGPQLAPLSDAGCLPELAWQPGGDLLAVGACQNLTGRVWIVRPHHKPVVVTRNGSLLPGEPWSRDGRVLLFYSLSGMHGVTSTGHSLWTAFADAPFGGWSSHGLLAVSVNHGAAVYDESGRRVFTYRLPSTTARFAWSDDGTRLAALSVRATGYTLVVRTSSGVALLSRSVPGGDMAWIGDRTIVFGEAGCSTCKTVGVDVRTGTVSPASSRWLGPRSADGKRAIVTPARSPAFSLGVATLADGATQTYSRVPGCSSDGDWTPAVTDPQFAGRAIVYQSWGLCDLPSDNLYSVGTAIHRLTTTRAQETQPALSPDGTEIAYVWAGARGMSCKGCSDGIRIASADGKPIRTLTNPQDCMFDDSPAWSPNGATILYSETGCDSPGELYTVPAGGGTPHDLGVQGVQPAWGPTRIAYDGNNGLTTAKPDGSDPVVVAKRGGMPAWSSTGELAYLVGGLYDRSVVVGSRAPVKLPFARVTSLGWTADATRLVLVASQTRNGPSDLWTVTVEGKDPVRLTRNFDVYSRFYNGPGG
jgi:Tol biopolymer transport system component